MKRLWLLLLCMLSGCKYSFHQSGVWHTNTLYFCQRCGREQFGRTFEDLEPISDDRLEEIHRENSFLEELNRG